VTTPNGSNATNVRHYNPDWLSDADLVAGFVARQELLAYFLDALRRAPLRGYVNHYLLVGVRGAGKTTLLKRLAVAIRAEADLADHLVAVSFPEELYQVKDLADFWWAACDALTDALEHLGHRAEADRLSDAVDHRAPSNPATGSTDDEGLRALLETCARLERRPVLLVDNLDLIMRRIDKRGRKVNDPNAPAYWALREALSRPDSPMVIGGSVRLSEPFIGHDKAFYDFFLPKRLGKLSYEEMRQVLEGLARSHGDPALEARLRAQPGRIHALHDLTGGNPRALGLLFELIRQGANGRAVDDFERLLDLTTPYYKARFEELPEQTQVVLHALATVRRTDDDEADPAPYNGSTAATIARKAGLETRIVSAQLDVLLDEGVVEKEGGGKGQGRTHYRIAEQLFRIWIQMRTTRRMRLQIAGLARFLEVLFDYEALEAATQAVDAKGDATPGGAKFALAMSEVSRGSEQRRAWERRAADAAVCLGDDGPDGLREVFPAGDLSPDLGMLSSCRAAMRSARAEIREAGEHVLAAIRWTVAEKAALVERLTAKETAEATLVEVRGALATERKRLLREGMTEAEIDAVYALRLKGALRLPDLSPEEVEAEARYSDVGDVRALAWSLLRALQVRFSDAAVADAWLRWALVHRVDASAKEWAGLCRGFRWARRYEAAEAALAESFRRGGGSRAWHERGSLLDEPSGNRRDAEVAYRKAIEIDPTDAWPWNGLGYLLASDASRADEANAAYRRAIELDPTFALPWNNLGNLLAEKLGRPDDAESAYRRAIELDPTDAWPWHNLGLILARDASRVGEAEEAYRQAIELDPTDAAPWNNLGITLADQLGRPEEAEAAYARAIELDPTDASPWNNLGVTLADRLGRPEEAEAAYARAIELDPNLAVAHRNMGRLLADHPNRLAEAESCFERAVELEPEHGHAKHLLAQVRAHRSIEPIVTAVDAGDRPAQLKALAATLDKLSADPNLLVGPAFVEGVVRRALHAGQGAALLADLRSLGYERVAAPLLVALDAALGNATAKLGRADPEVRTAAFRLFERLVAAGDARPK
jgi:tetratricopeptide (TPR) repeat protein